MIIKFIQDINALVTEALTPAQLEHLFVDKVRDLVYLNHGESISWPMKLTMDETKNNDK